MSSSLNSRNAGWSYLTCFGQPVGAHAKQGDMNDVQRHPLCGFAEKSAKNSLDISGVDLGSILAGAEAVALLTRSCWHSNLCHDSCTGVVRP